MTNWATLAIFSSFIFAFVAVLDKYLLAHSLPNVRIFYLAVGLIQIVMGIIILIIFPWDSNPTMIIILIALLSGAIWGTGLMLMFFCMSRLEVSRVIPIYHTSPVFVTIMALAFLGETLSQYQGIGILLAVSGAALIPMKPSETSQNAANPKLYLLVLVASILTATAKEINQSSKTGCYLITITNQNDIEVACFKGTVYRTNTKWFPKII